MNNIKLSKWFIVYAIALILNPLWFKLSSWIFMIIFFHESLHLLVAYLLGYKHQNIIIYPFGLCATIKDIDYMNIYHELLIIIVGPLSHLLMNLVITLFYNYHVISFAFFDYLTMVNYSMMIFNSLPIYPLDGGRLLQILFQIFFTYQKANLYVYYISMILLVVFGLFLHKPMIYMIVVHLLLQNIAFKKQLYYQTICFYEYRMKHPFKYPYVYHEHNDLYRGCMNVIKDEFGYRYENEWLKYKLNR